jgi:hypothetical protein
MRRKVTTKRKVVKPILGRGSIRITGRTKRSVYVKAKRIDKIPGVKFSSFKM